MVEITGPGVVRQCRELLRYHGYEVPEDNQKSIDKWLEVRSELNRARAERREGNEIRREHDGSGGQVAG